MLNLSKISSIIPYSEEWYLSRGGKFTSSPIFSIMGEKGIGATGMTYIRLKVGEKISGKSAEKNIMTESVIWGVVNEPLSLKYYQAENDIQFMVTDKHIIHSEMFASTPDALIIIREIGDTYDCETLETKSFQMAKHVQHCECTTPAQIKDINSQLYWQVISQMYAADVIVGNATFYHPDFPNDSKLKQHTVKFRKVDLVQDFKLFKNRLDEATQIFNTKYNHLKTK